MQTRSKVQAGTGRIVVRSADVHAQAVISELAASYPLKLLSPRSPRRNVCVVYMLTYGGGLVAGDQVNVSAEVLDGAVLVLLTQVSGDTLSTYSVPHYRSQGSTKVFKTRPGGRYARPSTMLVGDETSQLMNVVLGPSSAVFLLPDPVACFRAAKYVQSQMFHLQADSSVVLLDWITAGRQTLGEDWSFLKYHSLNEIWVEGVRVARDVMLLENKDRDIPGLPPRTLSDRLKPYSCYATLLMYGPLIESTKQALQDTYDKITLFKHTSPPDMIWSLSSIHHDKGCVVRVAATEMETVRNFLGRSLSPLRDVIGKDTYRNAFG